MKFKTVLLSIMLIAILFSLACGASKPGPAGTQADKSTITEGVMTTSVDNDSKPTSAVKASFPADTPAIYCSFKVSSVTQEDLIKASWYYIAGEAAGQENQLLDGGEMYTSAQADDQSYYLAFYYDKPAAGWYKGSYKVVLSINGVDKLSVPFNIE
jgi:hypothetical protein